MSAESDEHAEFGTASRVNTLFGKLPLRCMYKYKSIQRSGNFSNRACLLLSREYNISNNYLYIVNDTM